jgi:hypothetical protein
VARERPIVDRHTLGVDEIRVGRSRPLRVEEDLEGVGSAVHVDDENLGVLVVLVGDLARGLGRERRVRVVSDGVDLLKLEVLVGRVDDLDVEGLATEGQGGGRSGGVDGDGGIL